MGAQCWGGTNNRRVVILSQTGPIVVEQWLQRSGEKLAESAEKIKHSTYGVEDSAEGATQLAADRTVFAAERTYAAWVRTGLLALASGIGAKALLSEVIPEWLNARRRRDYGSPRWSVEDGGDSGFPGDRLSSGLGPA
jgi:hypothetical protein